MDNFKNPNQMTHDQRYDEVASILAAGILRLRLKKAQTNENRELFILDNGNRMVPYGTPNHVDIERDKP